MNPRPALPAPRGHWALPWLLLLLALPGAGWSMYVALLASASFFGEQPAETDLATSVAAYLSGASLFAVTAVITVVAYRRFAVAVLCALAAVTFVGIAGEINEPDVSLTAADDSGWLAAWTLPTSWAIAAYSCIVALRGIRRVAARRAPRRHRSG